MSIVYRPLLQSENDFLEKNLAYWLEERDFEKFLQTNYFIIGVGRWKEVFITNHSTMELLESNPQVKPYSVGIGFGELQGKDFRLSLGGANILATLTKKKVVVTSDSEQLFLYQRDIFCKSILEYDRTLKVKDKMLVMNEQGDCLGIGKLIIPVEELKEQENRNKEAIRNLMDLGWYLRKGK